MKHVVIGLGNPGARYDLTRHNIGFAVVETWAQQTGTQWRERPAWNAQVAEVSPELCLVKPTTFMNDSGRTIAALGRYFDLESEQICVIVDDRDLPFGKIRWRDGIRTGAHHNGLRSIAKEYGSVARLRIGISNDHMRHKPLRDFVLDRFTGHEQTELPGIIKVAIELLQDKYK